MNLTPKLHRLVTGTLLASMIVATSASIASADSRNRRYKGDRRGGYNTRVVYRDVRPSSTYIVRRSSSAGPAIAGFLGGLFLGAAIAHSAPTGYSYYDPYCHERFASLDVYRAHSHRHHHAGIVRVVAIDSGSYVGTYGCEDDGRYTRIHDRDAGYYDRDGRDRDGYSRDRDDRDWDDEDQDWDHR